MTKTGQARLLVTPEDGRCKPSVSAEGEQPHEVDSYRSHRQAQRSQGVGRAAMNGIAAHVCEWLVIIGAFAWLCEWMLDRRGPK
jgi:hypothetical protein